MAGYEASRSPNIFQRIGGYFSAAGRGAGQGVRDYTTSIGSRWQDSGMMGRMGQIMDAGAPGATLARELGQGAVAGLRGESQNNAEMAHDLDVLRNDPGYTGNYTSGGNGGGYAGVFAGSPANSFLTGNFSPSQMNSGSNNPLVNLNYGQNAQQHQMRGGGLPGITGPNIYGGAPSVPQFSSTGGAATTLAGNGRGSTVRNISMSQLESMLSAGIGSGGISAHATPGREMSEMRDARRAEGGGRPAGMSVKDYIMQ